MRILQLIDSLHTGGGEMMAVHLANLLKDEHESHLMVTRTEGPLKQKILPGVHYQFLGKKSSIDPLAFLRFIRYIRKHKIQIVHAHSTSVFMPLLLRKLLPRKTKIVWHDHHGEPLNKRSYFKLLKKNLSGIDFFISVNHQRLSELKELKVSGKKIERLGNFPVLDQKFFRDIKDRENIIVQTGNLKHPKNHLLALQAFRILTKEIDNWRFIIIGNDFNDTYSQEIKNFIRKNKLQDKVEIKSGITEISPFLFQSKIGILSSDSEGLPLAILEYGLAGLAVVSTKVGGISDVIEHEINGLLVPPGNARKFARALASLIEHESVRQVYARRLQEKVKNHYSADNYKNRLTEIYGRLLSS